NHPMGPFEMVDLVGLDVRLSILEFLHKSLGEAFRPNNLLVQHVRAGRLGRKVGRGVYEYDEDGKRVGEGIASTLLSCPDVLVDALGAGLADADEEVRGERQARVEALAQLAQAAQLDLREEAEGPHHPRKGLLARARTH